MGGLPDIQVPFFGFRKVKQSLPVADNAQFGVIQHDFFLSVVLEHNGRYRVMCRTFDSGDFSEAKLLVLDILADFQTGGITGSKIC